MNCPECKEEIWDLPHGHKLAKCWNAEGQPIRRTPRARIPWEMTTTANRDADTQSKPREGPAR